MNTYMEGTQERAELARLAEWTSGAMSAAESERFEAELLANPELFERMAPYLELTLGNEPLPEIQEQIDVMTAELAADEHAAARAQGWKHLTAALASLFTIKAIAALATAGIVIAIAWPASSPVDDMPKRFFVHHARQQEKTQVAVTTHPKHPRRTGAPAQQPAEVVAVVPSVDSATLHAADSIMKSIALPSNAVAATTVATAEPQPVPKQKEKVWIRDDEVTKPGFVDMVKRAGGALKHAPGTIWRTLTGRGGGK